MSCAVLRLRHAATSSTTEDMSPYVASIVWELGTAAAGSTRAWQRRARRRSGGGPSGGGTSTLVIAGVAAAPQWWWFWQIWVEGGDGAGWIRVEGGTAG